MTFGGGGRGAAIDGAGTIGAGGAGGGIALIFAKNLSVTNTSDVSADGGFGDSENYGGGSGGAGGSIFIRSQQASLATNLVTAQGGVGGDKPASNPGWDSTWTTRPGGDGGVGRIHIESCAPISGSTAPSANTKIDSTLCNPRHRLLPPPSRLHRVQPQR